MCLSSLSTLHLGPGLKRSITEPSARASIRALRALIDLLASKPSSSIVESGFSGGNCHLPLSRSQSLLLAALVTEFVPHSTWWSTHEEPDSWVLYGELGADSGPNVIVCITAMSDRDALPS